MAKILYVDADRERSRVMIRLLCEKGHYVVPTSSAERAMMHVERESDYDAVVVHLILPGIDGAELCRWLQKWSSLPRAPRVVFSGPEAHLCVDLEGGLPRWLPADVYLHNVADAVSIVEAVEGILCPP